VKCGVWGGVSVAKEKSELRLNQGKREEAAEKKQKKKEEEEEGEEGKQEQTPAREGLMGQL
jgi:hypothetical protein